MTKEELSQLASKIAEGKASMAELALYNAACEAFQEEKIGWPGMEKDLVEMEVASLKQLWDEQADNGVVTKSLWPRLIGVAAAVAVVVFGVWFFNGRTEILRGALDDKSMAYQNDIAPGKNAATIKIGDGAAITLSDKQTGVIVGDDLRYSDNSVVIQNDPLSSRANAKDLFNSINKRSLPYGRDDGRARSLTVTTPRGGTYQVTLPDGTKVWLNAASRLTYTMPLNERGGIRKVELSGEAYFEVFRNKNQPFVVTTKNLTTTVLGTHFNISAYDDEGSTKATLLEGSVRVASFRGKRSDEKPLGHANSRDFSYRRDDGRGAESGVVLKPSQQAIVTGSTNIAVKQVDPEMAIAWKKGIFDFNNTPVETIMKQLGRWYDVEIVYQDAEAKTATLSGAVSRYDKVSRVLKALEFTGSVKFTIEERRIIVRSNK